MADRYWRGGTGTWNSSNTANWSATSGGAGGASVPTTSDDVYFNAASGSGTVTISGAINALSVNFTGATLTLTGSGTLNYVGSFTMGSGITIGGGLGGILRQSMASGVRTFTSAGKTLPFAIQFYATGGVITFQDALTCTGGVSQSGNHTLTWGNFTHTTTSWYQDTGTSNFTSPGKVVCSRSTAGSAFSMPINSGFNNAISVYNRFEVLSPPAGVTVTVDPGFRSEDKSAKLYYINSGTGTIQTNGGGTGTGSGHAWLIDVGAGSFSVSGLNGIRSVTASASWTGTFTGSLSALAIDATGTTINLGAARTNATGVFLASASGAGTHPINIDSSITFTTAPTSTAANSVFTNGVLTLRSNAVLTLRSLRFAPTLTGSGFNFGTGSEKLVLDRATPSGDVFFVNTAGSYTNVNITNRKAIDISAPNSGVTTDIKLPEGVNDRSKLFSFNMVSGGTGTIQFNNATGTTYSSSIGVQDLTLANSAYTVSILPGAFTDGPYINGNLTVGGASIAPNFFTYQTVNFVANSAPQTLNTNGATVFFTIALGNTSSGEFRLASNVTLDGAITPLSLNFGTPSLGSGQGHLNLQSFRLTCGGIFSATISSAINVNFGATGAIRVRNLSSSSQQLFNIDTQYYGTISGSKTIEVEAFGTFAQNYLRYFQQNATTADYTKAFTIRVVNTGVTGMVGDNGNVGSLILEDGPYAFNGGSNTFAQVSNIYQNLDILGSSINFVNGGSSSTFQFAGGSGVPASNVNTYGSTLNIGFTLQSSGKQVNLAGATTIRSFDLLVGALSLSSFTLTCTSYFNATNSGTVRNLDLGTGSIYLTSNATGTVFNVTNITNFTLSGTSRKIYITTPGTGVTKTSSVGASATIIFDFEPIVVNTGGTINFSNGNFRNFDIPGGTYTIGLPASYSIYGNLSVAGAITAYTGGGTAQDFSATTGTQTINTNGATFGGTGAITLNTASIKQLTGNSNFAGNMTLTSSTLDLNGFRLTVPVFNSSNTNVRTIAFGSTGAIRLTGSTTVFDTTTTSNLTVTGTNTTIEPNLNSNQTVNVGTPVPALFDVSVPSTATASNNLIFTSNTNIRNLTLSNVAYFVSNNPINIYGSLTVLGTAPQFTAGSNAWSFRATSGSNTITTNGETLPFPIIFNGAGSTLALNDNLTLGSGRAFTHTAGTLDLSTRTLTADTFDTSNSNTRAITFGTGSKIVVQNASGSGFTAATATGLTVTGTNRIVEANFAGGGSTALTGGQVASDAALFDAVVASTFTGTVTVSNYWRNVTFQNASYTIAAPTSTTRVYGNYAILGASPTLTAGTSALTFAATSGTNTIQTSGKTLDFPVTFDGVGGTWQLSDAFTVGSSRTVTLTNGTFNANNFSVSMGSFSSSNSNVRALTMGNATWTLTLSGTVWNITTATNMTLTRGTGASAAIVVNNTGTKTFIAGGLTYPRMTHGASGTLQITGTNSRFANLTQTAGVANSILFDSGSTFLFDDFTLTGASAAARTTLSATSTSNATISRSSGVVSSNFLNISYNTATGGATWYAGTGSLQGTSVSGWIFTAPPQASGNMLMVFM